MAGKIPVFIAGGAIGAVLALMYAPRTGEEMRAIVADKATEAWGDAQDFSAGAQMRGQQMYGDVASRGQSAYQSASENVQSVYQSAASNVQQGFSQVADAAQSAFSGVQSRVQEVTRGNVAPVFTDNNDELREKIEAARQRIAAQVAKNAEAASEAMPTTVEPVEPVDAQATVNDVVEAAADAVADAATQVADAASEVAADAADAK